MSYIVVEQLFGTEIGREFPTTKGTEKFTLTHLKRRYGKNFQKAKRVYKRISDIDGTCLIIKGDRYEREN